MFDFSWSPRQYKWYDSISPPPKSVWIQHVDACSLVCKVMSYYNIFLAWCFTKNLNPWYSTCTLHTLQLHYNIQTVSPLTKMSNKKHLVKRGAFLFLFSLIYDLNFGIYVTVFHGLKKLLFLSMKTTWRKLNRYAI